MLIASRRIVRSLPVAAALASAVWLTGCGGIQSTLAPAGREAERIADLFWWMTLGSVIVWIGVVALALYYARHPAGSPDRRRNRILVIGGGVLLPTVTVTALLIYGLAMLPPAVARAPEGSLQVAVTGEQWWWRVRYRAPGGGEIVLANEVRMPVGEPVQFSLDSDNVLHSFWIPSLAGKMDMIPGRTTHLAIRPTATGVFRGACAEYCGTSHALMAFYVEVMEPGAFAQWLEHQASPAMPPAGPVEQRGQAAFTTMGCGACHTIRGTTATGVIGPDLTHVGSRLSLAAGILRNDTGTMARWIASPTHIKPGVHMPAFDMMPATEREAIAAYLHGLK